jgi:MerR family redox-sensitive transcriptional activator SoxR
MINTRAMPPQAFPRRVATIPAVQSPSVTTLPGPCLSIDRCKLANPYDELGKNGPGPRRLLGESRVCTATDACADEAQNSAAYG